MTHNTTLLVPHGGFVAFLSAGYLATESLYGVAFAGLAWGIFNTINRTIVKIKERK